MRFVRPVEWTCVKQRTSNWAAVIRKLAATQRHSKWHGLLASAISLIMCLIPEPWEDPKNCTPNSSLKASDGVDYLRWIQFLDPSRTLRSPRALTEHSWVRSMAKTLKGAIPGRQRVSHQDRLGPQAQK